MHGLSISPDLDTVTYTLADAIDPARGWGLVDESWRVMESLGPYDAVKPAAFECRHHGGSISATAIWPRICTAPPDSPKGSV